MCDKHNIVNMWQPGIDRQYAGIAQRQSNCLVSSRSGYRNSLPAPISGVVTLESAGPALAPEIPYVAVAQLVEHLIAIQKVAGSNPVSHSSPPFLAKGKGAHSNYNFLNSLDGLNTFLLRKQSPVRVRF